MEQLVSRHGDCRADRSTGRSRRRTLRPSECAATSIALGCVDPVSGIAVIEPEYAEGFAIREISGAGGLTSPYWVVDNYDQAIANAYARQSAMMEEVRARCGINRFYDLMHSVYSLIVGTCSSEFVDLTDATFSSGQLHLVPPAENLELGIVGAFAGKQGKTYPAHRYHQQVVKTFRFAMSRRTDASRVQLGYRMAVSVGGGASGEANIVMCPYSRLNTPIRSVDIFPSGTRSATITAPNAVVYDVIQTDVFSAAEEDAFEKTGSVPKTGRIYSLAPKQRIYVNPRAGAVNLQIKVTFDFDINNNDQAFFGFANVEVSSGDVDANAHGFLATVEVYETVSPFDSTTNDSPREQLADVMTLHFAPSFLMAPGDYFTDRDEGYAEMERSFKTVSEKYAKSAAVGGIDPIARVSRQAQVERAVSAFADTQLRTHPREMHALLNRLQVRAPSTQNP